jgi:hypothetical protein
LARAEFQARESGQARALAQEQAPAQVERRSKRCLE